MPKLFKAEVYIMVDFIVEPCKPHDKEAWKILFKGYADFYQRPLEEKTIEAVWGWLLDEGHSLEGFIVRDAHTLRVVGLAHIKAIPHALSGQNIGFLDDMFIAKEARGKGASDALLKALNTLAQERGWPVIRWVTQHFNQRGRAFYDRYTQGPTDFIMYQWEVNA